MNTPARNRRKKMGYLAISHRKHPIYEGINTIGRDKEATVIIRDLRASHQHAIIVVIDNDQHFIADMKSANGTELQGNILRSHELYPIEDGCQVKLASEIKATYTKVIDENLSMSMITSQNTQVDDGCYAAQTQIVEDSVSFAVPLAPPPKENTDLFPDDDASFSAINTQALIQQINSRDNDQKCSASKSFEDLPTQVVTVPTQNVLKGNDVSDIHDMATQVLDIHDMSTQVIEQTNSFHDMATQVIEVSNDGSCCNEPEQTVTDAKVNNDDTCRDVDGAVTNMTVNNDDTCRDVDGAVTNMTVNNDDTCCNVGDQAVTNSTGNNGDTCSNVEDQIVTDATKNREDTCRNGQDQKETKMAADEISDLEKKPAENCNDSSKDENHQNSCNVPELKPNDKGEDSNDLDGQSQLQTSLLKRRLRNVLHSDNESKSPESFVDSDPQSQLPLGNMKRNVSNVIRSDSENEADRKMEKFDWSGDSEDFATVNVKWEDVSTPLASTTSGPSPKRKLCKRSTNSTHKPDKDDSSSDDTDVEDNETSKKQCIVLPENIAQNVQQDLHGSTDCSTSSDHKILANNSDSDTDVEGNIKYNASFLETTTDSFVEKQRSLNVTNDFIPATQDAHNPGQNDEDDDIIPSTQCNMSNSDSLCFSLRVECSEDEAGSKNTKNLSPEAAAPSSNIDDFQSAKTDFDFAVPKAAKKEFGTLKQKETNVEDKFDFDCPTQKINVTEKNDVDFVAPTQELLSDSFDFEAPTQRTNAAKAFETSSDADFDAPTQKIVGSTLDFEAATEKLFEPQKQSSNDNFDFDVPTQRIDNHRIGFKSIDADFDAPTQKVVVEKLPETNYENKSTSVKNDSFNFVPATQDVVNDSFDFDAPTQRITNPKAIAEFKKPTEKPSDSDFEASTQKFVKPNCEYVDHFDIPTQKIDFDAPTQKITVEFNEEKEQLDEFELMAPTQQIVQPTILEDAPEIAPSTNVPKDISSFDLKTQEAAKTSKKKVSFGHVENLEGNTKGVESQLEVIFATQAVFTSPDPDRPTDPIGEAFNNASTQEVLNCLAADSSAHSGIDLKDKVEERVTKTRLSKLSTIKHDSDEEKDLTDFSDDECRNANEVKLPDKSGNSSVVNKSPVKVGMKSFVQENADILDANKTKKSGSMQSKRRSTRNTKSRTTPDKEILSNNENVTLGGDKKLRKSRRGSTEKEVVETISEKQTRKKNREDKECDDLKKPCLPNIEEDAELSDSPIDNEKETTSLSKVMADPKRKRTRKGSIEKESSSESQQPKRTRAGGESERSSRLRTRSSVERTIVSDVKESGTVKQLLEDVAEEDVASGEMASSVKIEDNQKRKRVLTKKTKRTKAGPSVVTEEPISDNDESQGSKNDNVKSTRSKRLKTLNICNEEGEIGEVDVEASTDTGSVTSESSSGSKKRTNLNKKNAKIIQSEQTVISGGKEESDSTKLPSESSELPDLKKGRLRSKRKSPSVEKDTAKDVTKSTDVHSSTSSGNATNKRHVGNDTVLNVTCKKTKSEGDKIKITVPKKQINLEISDSEVTQQSFVADATFNKAPEKRPKRERMQEEPNSSKRLRKVEESQLTSPERKKRNLKPKIVFTMLDSPELCQIIRSLGGYVVDSVDNCTVLVTKNVLRSQKLLCAVAQGKPICSPDWLYACKKANLFLDPWKHLINDEEAEKKWNFSLSLSFKRSRESKLFEGYSFQLIVNNATDVLKGAIESAGGKCVSRAPKVGSKFLVIASQENKSKCAKFAKQGIKIALPEAIFDGVLRQELVFDKHLLLV